MSAKWRRNKKRSRWSNVFRDFNKVKDRKTPQAFQNKNSRIKRRTYPYKYRLPRTDRGRIWKELEPLIDVLEEKDEIIVVAGFAGFRRENLKIHVQDQRLTLSAEALDRKYHKSLNLPKRVIPDATRTTYKNGVLEIRLKKALEEKISTR
ncbi:MAG: Hsp20/alpha crystallin family protein [Candidatus Bathyarchaeota archaeon]|nr:Hsp20/alpha crystallin family protein [Candidatus Bathyarchaeota archaeon]MDH5747350.1 Hsp20/alpha crystallin family protein [Candidatus Bathyarchaeota archaeon]